MKRKYSISFSYESHSDGFARESTKAVVHIPSFGGRMRIRIVARVEAMTEALVEALIKAWRVGWRKSLMHIRIKAWIVTITWINVRIHFVIHLFDLTPFSETRKDNNYDYYKR